MLEIGTINDLSDDKPMQFCNYLLVPFSGSDQKRA